VLADTHLRTGLEALDRRVVDAMGRSDLVVHAGDIVSARVLDDLRAICDVHAVLGNNDHELVGALPDELRLGLAGVNVAVVHDSGPARGRAVRMALRFPGADLVVFGHSHVPVDERGVGRQLLFNPGSPTQRRSQSHRTFGSLQLEKGRVTSHRIVTLD